MKLPLLSYLLIYICAFLCNFVVLGKPSYAENKFSCEPRNNIPFTMIRTTRGKEAMIRWVVKDFVKSGYTPKKRCEKVSLKMQRYYDNGMLFFTIRENLNGYPVLCMVTIKKESSCGADDILVMLKPGTNAGKVLRQMIAFRSSNGKPIDLSGSKIVSYDENAVFYLDVKKMIDELYEGINTDINSSQSN
jgi:hypothetical protein